MFEKLEGYVKWDLKNCDLKDNGLWEWVINEKTKDGDHVHSRSDESGTNNPPRFDGESRTNSIDFSTFITNDVDVFFILKKLLRKKESVKKWNKIFENTKVKVNSVRNFSWGACFVVDFFQRENLYEYRNT